MDRALLDTDVLSEILKGVNTNVAAEAAAYYGDFGYYTTSLITVPEVVKGYHKMGREDRIQKSSQYCRRSSCFRLICKAPRVLAAFSVT